MHKRNTTRAGFTIVELLIVVVVIAILAAITVVAYRNINDRANVSAASSEASQAAKKIQLYYAENESYPTSLSAAGITDTNNFQYAFSNSASPKTFCITATSGNKSMKADSTKTTPTEGGCAGHGVGGVAAVTNLIVNPSFETNLDGWYENSNMPIQRVNEWSNSGANSLRATNTNGWSIQVRSNSSIAVPAAPGEVFSARAMTRSGVNQLQGVTMRIEWYGPSGGSEPFANAAGTAVNIPLGNSSLIRLDGAVAPANTASTRLRIYSSTSPTGTVMYVDSVMLTKSSVSHNFADGNTVGWVWNGPPNLSTSTGPAP